MANEQIKQELLTIYDEMLKLYLKQSELGYELIKERSEQGKPLHDRKWEETVLESIAANSPMGMQSYSVEFFRSILTGNRQYFEDNK